MWPDYDVVVVDEDDLPEMDERFALALVPNPDGLFWCELMATARVEAADAADAFEWSVYESQCSDGR